MKMSSRDVIVKSGKLTLVPETAGGKKSKVYVLLYEREQDCFADVFNDDGCTLHFGRINVKKCAVETSDDNDLQFSVREKSSDSRGMVFLVRDHGQLKDWVDAFKLRTEEDLQTPCKVMLSTTPCGSRTPSPLISPKMPSARYKLRSPLSLSPDSHSSPNSSLTSPLPSPGRSPASSAQASPLIAMHRRKRRSLNNSPISPRKSLEVLQIVPSIQLEKKNEEQVCLKK